MLVGLNVTSRGSQRPPSGVESNLASAQESLEELEALAATSGARVAEVVIQSRPRPDAATLVGSGKVDELKAKIHFHEANVAIFDVRVNPPMDPNFAEIVEGEVVRVLRDQKSITVINCFDCRAPKVEVREDTPIPVYKKPNRISRRQRVNVGRVPLRRRGRWPVYPGLHTVCTLRPISSDTAGSALQHRARKRRLLANASTTAQRARAGISKSASLGL